MSISFPQLLLLSVLVVYATTGDHMNAHAQTAATAHALSIPSLPLGQALNELAQQADLELSFPPALVAGQTAPALSGNLTPRQALDRLLAGTGLAATIDGNQVTIGRRAIAPRSGNDDAAARTLSAVRVTGSYTPTATDDAVTNYTVRRSSTATKLDLSIKETPQSLTIFTQKQIEDQNLQQVADILRATPGVSVQEYGVPGAGRATFFARGYEIANIQIDGMPTSANMFGGIDLMGSMDTALYERVEIIRGSTGLTTGVGDPSASINFVRKRPGYDPQYRVSASYGTWAKRRIEADLSHPFNASGSLRGRIVAVAAEGNHWMERVHDKSRLFYGIVEADITGRTTLSLSYTGFGKFVDDASPLGTSLRSNTNSIYDMFSDRGRHFNPATQWSYASQDVRQWFAQARHEFNDDWTASISYQHTRTKPNRVYGILGLNRYYATTGDAALSFGRVKTDNTMWNLDLTLVGKFKLWGRDAQIAVGYNGYQSDVDVPSWYTDFNFGQIAGVPYYNHDTWNDGDVPIPRMFGEPVIDQYSNIRRYRENSSGLFASVKLKPLQDLTVILGARRSRYDMTATQVENNAGSSAPFRVTPLKQSWKVIPYAGLIYDLTPKTALYASYTGIHKPQRYVAGVTAKEREDNGIVFRPLPPTEGNTIEVGIKSALFDERLNLHAAVFRMHEKNFPYFSNTTVSDEGEITRLICENPYSDAQVCDPMQATNGPVISGLELNISGALTERWLINAGYTYLHLKMHDVNKYQPPSDSKIANGYDFNRPKHMFSLFTSYKFGDRLTLGGGVRWKSRSTQRTYNSYTDQVYDFSQSSYAVVDLMARYDLGRHATLGLNIGNVFDKVYFANESASYFGAPRSVTASLSLAF